MNAIEELIYHINASGLEAIKKTEAVHNLTNIKEEVNENEVPDRSRIARWLNKSKEIISVGTAGAELLEKADKVFKLFSGDF